jgi:hypothetical protein
MSSTSETETAKNTNLIPEKSTILITGGATGN